MGVATSESVKTSDVGVIMAAMIRIMTIACRLYLRMKEEDMKPSLANNHAKTGISNTIPIAKDSVMSAEM